MISESGGYIIVYNGEIYNYIELKKYLSGKYNFKSAPDTEVRILSLIEIYGLEQALNYCFGMFAFALYDKANNQCC